MTTKQTIPPVQTACCTPADEKNNSHLRFLPDWMQTHWTALMVASAGLFWLLGWLSESVFDWPRAVYLIFFWLSYAAGGYDLILHAVPGLFKGRFDTDILMLAAALGAGILGEWAEGAFLLFLFALGHAGEHYALDRARDAVNALGELMPSTAWLKQNGRLVEVPVETLAINNEVVVRAGDNVPVDGVVIAGETDIDQSPITGESVPVHKQEGDEVFAGTINGDGGIEVRVTKLAEENTLAKVMQLVADAQSQQSDTQRLAERFSTKFVPGILVLVVLVTIIPPLFGWMTLEASFYRAMLLLVAASPCALAIGTPASVLAGIGQAARNGVLIKGGGYLEQLGQVKVMAFDKTGTLTTGTFAVTDTVPYGDYSKQALIRLAASVEQQANHPLARAVVQEAKGQELSPVSDVVTVAGKGITAVLDHKPIKLGNAHLFDSVPDEIKATVKRLASNGRSTIIVQHGQQFVGVLGLADQPRPQAKQTIAALKQLGIQEVVMLTGDNDMVAQQIGREVGITHIQAKLLPEQKLQAIQMLETQYGSIAMTGDGVNDAPALATATVGIAMGGAGTAVALETADVALMGDSIDKLPFAVGLSRAARRNILQNFGLALGVIILLIITSVFGLIELSGAVILHEGSTILVVLNALRLLRYG